MSSQSIHYLKEGYIIRAPTLDDIEGAVELMNIVALKTIGKADETVEDTREEWQMPGFNIATDTRLVVAPDGRIVGYGNVMDTVRPMTPFIDVYIHPDYWADTLDVELMQWAEERANEAMANPKVPADARVVMQAATYASDTYYKGMLERAGMQISRLQWQMQIDFDGAPPAPEWPQGITVRTVAPGEDLRPLLVVFRDAWKDHWGYVDTPFEEHYARWNHYYREDEHFDPSLWFVAMDDDQIAGFSYCKPSHGDDNDFGWVQTLAVLRSYRKQGVGMALLLHSFEELHRRGKKRVGLGVDAGSLTGATRLYQRAGMHIVLQAEVYEKELRPGIEYRTQDVETD